MEDEKKKKRQKKKKNKQGKMNRSVAAGVGEPTSENNNHANVTKQNHQNLNSEPDVESQGSQKSVVDSDSWAIDGTENSSSVDAEKSNWLDREDSLERKVKELQEQLDVHIKKEADLETNVSQSQKERDLWHDKEAELETRILHIQTEKDSWLQKEAGYEEEIDRLVEEATTLRSMGVSLNKKLTQMEEEKATLVQRENSAAETISSLNKDNARLRAQVIELEASRNDISHQNQQLKEHVSDLQSKIHSLESSVAIRLSSERMMHVAENEDMKSQLESARALVEKLVSENEKLVEKANKLNAKPDQKSVTTETSLPMKSDIDAPIASSAERVETISPSESREGMASDKIMDEVIRLKRDSNNSSMNRVSLESGEIVQIPLDENETTAPPPPPAAAAAETEDVPLTDAPLIGAPFRLISFVARYVSGADLVDKS